MLSEPVVNLLKTLCLRADAQRKVSFIPLGSIYWDDELPEIRELFRLSEDDRRQVWRPFSIRFKVWDRQSLNEDDQEFWNSARSQVPDWAFWGRLALSVEDQLARVDAELAVERDFEAFFTGADEVTVTQQGPGVQSFHAKFDLSKAPPVKKKPWWKRLRFLQ